LFTFYLPGRTFTPRRFWLVRLPTFTHIHVLVLPHVVGLVLGCTLVYVAFGSVPHIHILFCVLPVVAALPRCPVYVHSPFTFGSGFTRCLCVGLRSLDYWLYVPFLWLIYSRTRYAFVAFVVTTFSSRSAVVDLYLRSRLRLYTFRLRLRSDVAFDLHVVYVYVRTHDFPTLHSWSVWFWHTCAGYTPYTTHCLHVPVVVDRVTFGCGYVPLLGLFRSSQCVVLTVRFTFDLRYAFTFVYVLPLVGVAHVVVTFTCAHCVRWSVPVCCRLLVGHLFSRLSRLRLRLRCLLVWLRVGLRCCVDYVWIFPFGCFLRLRLPFYVLPFYVVRLPGYRCWIFHTTLRCWVTFGYVYVLLRLYVFVYTFGLLTFHVRFPRTRFRIHIAFASVTIHPLRVGSLRAFPLFAVSGCLLPYVPVPYDLFVTDLCPFTRVYTFTFRWVTFSRTFGCPSFTFTPFTVLRLRSRTAFYVFVFGYTFTFALLRLLHTRSILRFAFVVCGYVLRLVRLRLRLLRSFVDFRFRLFCGCHVLRFDFAFWLVYGFRTFAFARFVALRFARCLRLFSRCCAHTFICAVCYHAFIYTFGYVYVRSALFGYYVCVPVYGYCVGLRTTVPVYVCCATTLRLRWLRSVAILPFGLVTFTARLRSSLVCVCVRSLVARYVTLVTRRSRYVLHTRAVPLPVRFYTVQRVYVHHRLVTFLLRFGYAGCRLNILRLPVSRCRRFAFCVYLRSFCTRCSLVVATTPRALRFVCSTRCVCWFGARLRYVSFLRLLRLVGLRSFTHHVRLRLFHGYVWVYGYGCSRCTFVTLRLRSFALLLRLPGCWLPFTFHTFTLVPV